MFNIDYKLISKEAGDIIVESEVTSEARYTAKYARPTWPGGDSGVTVGIGIDLGYATPDSIRKDWGGRVMPEIIDMMVKCAGAKAGTASAIVASKRYVGIVIPWDVAVKHFVEVELPRWTAKAYKTFPGIEKLGPDCLGAVVSLIFNRGESVSDKPGETRRLEMRNIKALIGRGEYRKVPQEFRNMKRLWVGKGLDGLLTRRDTEARLFERGLTRLGI